MSPSKILVPVLSGVRATLEPVVVEDKPQACGIFSADGKLARESTIRVASAIAQMTGEPMFWNVAVRLPEGAGASADLGAAVASLTARGACPSDDFDRAYVGELAFDGGLRPTRDVYAAASESGRRGQVRLVAPARAAAAAAAGAMAHGDQGDQAVPWVLLADSLADVRAHLRAESCLPGVGLPASGPRREAEDDLGPLSWNLEPVLARCVDEIAAGRSVLLRGSPGSGRTMVARRIAARLPRLTSAEAHEVATVHHAAGIMSPEVGLWFRAPFRAPHHTVSEMGLVGGGTPVRPGEASLAHHGVLYLDEATEFRRPALLAVLAARRSGSVRFMRRGKDIDIPARFGLIGSTHLCPCGYWGEPRCHCEGERQARYLDRIPADLFDVTIDL